MASLYIKMLAVAAVLIGAGGVLWALLPAESYWAGLGVVLLGVLVLGATIREAISPVRDNVARQEHRVPPETNREEL